jgi:alpha-tubulin suppressor-like RCC1 family protein
MTAVVPVGGIDNKILIYWANPLNRVAQSKELFAQLPSISAFSPNEGKAGNTIKLSGVNLGQVNLVTIDGISQSIISATRTALELELSQNNLPGMKSIMAKNAAGTAESKPFNVLPKVTVSVSNLLPKGMIEGRATTVTITGDHFEEVTSVMMNGVAQNIVSRSANQLKIELPADAKTGPIILQAADIKQVVDAGLFLVSKRRLIASGRKRTCAVNQDNTVKCWGLIPENVAPKGAFAMGGYVDSAAKLVPSLKSVATVVVGLYESCVLINDGSIQCWGAKTYWNNIDPFSTTPYLIEGLKYPAVDITIAQWNNTFCALTEMQSVYCWGNGEYISNVKTGLEKNVIAIEASSTSHCALMTDGTIKCWTDGQLPKQVGGINARAIEIAADSGNYFVLTDQGRVLKFKQGELSAYQLEVDVSTLIRGSGGACASMKSGNFKCWVNNGDYGTSMPANLAPTLTSLTDTLAVGIGGGFACIMSRTGTIRCMSSGIGGWAHHYGEGQLGDGYYDGLPVTPSSTTSGYTTIASGYGQHCAITSTGLTRCWGTNLPDNYEIVDLNIKAMVIGALHKCALTDAGSVKCWGNNQYGQLGNNRTGTNSVNEYVTPIGLTSGVKSIAGSGAYTCALLTTGKVKCWGALFSSPPMSSTPSPVLSAPTTIGNLVESVKAIFSGDFRTCAILSTGIIKCWSFNFQDSPTATELSGFKAPINALAIGYEHLCALTSTKEVQCLGVNSFGQVGNGQWSYYVSTPQDVYNLGNDIVEITAQARSTCARNTTGKIKCWGQQPNAVSNLFAPKEVLGLDAGITKISAETNSTCALNQQGAVKCWGRPSSEGTVRNNLGLDTSKYYNEELIPVQDAP